MRRKRNYWNKETSYAAALEFKYRNEFSKKYVGAYEFLRKNHLLNDACKHMIKPENINKKWTYDTCKEEALKYEYLHEFRKKSESAYSVSIKNNWLNGFKEFLKKYKPPIKWTKKICQKEALKYKNRNDFIINSYNIYHACLRHEWLNDVCSHMNKPHSNRFKWTKEDCGKIAKNYNYRKEFQKGNTNAYSAARHNGWLDDICSHMKYKKLPNRYWHNYDNCKKEALKYEYKKDFYSKSQHCYNMSLKNGWIDEICLHMKILGDKYHRCIYSYEFSDNHVYVGLTYNIDKREMRRLKDKKDAVTIHKIKTGLIPIRKQLTEYLSIEKAIKLEKHYLDKYMKDGWIKLNRVKTGGLGGKYDKV